MFAHTMSSEVKRVIMTLQMIQSRRGGQGERGGPARAHNTGHPLAPVPGGFDCGADRHPHRQAPAVSSTLSFPRNPPSSSAPRVPVGHTELAPRTAHEVPFAFLTMVLMPHGPGDRSGFTTLRVATGVRQLRAQEGPSTYDMNRAPGEFGPRLRKRADSHSHLENIRIPLT